jgi:cytochrome c-type biogenesis protein CcmH
MNRRQFFGQSGRYAVAIGAASVATGFALRAAGAQDGSAQQGSAGLEMTSDSYKPVRLPPKADATPQMDSKAVEAFERNLACPCPCTLDVYTCRTTDFNCAISPAVHRDVLAMVDGGYSADEIMTALTDTYGDFILMTPRKRGFNLLAWFAPFAAIGIGAVIIGAVLRTWRRNSTDAAQVAEEAERAGTDETQVDATPEELARLEAVLRDDSR